MMQIKRLKVVANAENKQKQTNHVRSSHDGDLTGAILLNPIS